MGANQRRPLRKSNGRSKIAGVVDRGRTGHAVRHAMRRGPRIADPRERGVGIDTEIAYLTEWATIGVSEVEGFVDANPNPDEATKAEIIQARSLIQAYRDRITDLHLEKENLRLTLGRP